jgi:hypothetical protein
MDFKNKYFMAMYAHLIGLFCFAQFAHKTVRFPMLALAENIISIGLFAFSIFVLCKYKDTFVGTKTRVWIVRIFFGLATLLFGIVFLDDLTVIAQADTRAVMQLINLGLLLISNCLLISRTRIQAAE